MGRMRSEHHGIRAVLEAHVQRSPVAGKEEATANGIAVAVGSHRFRVTDAAGGTAVYVIDRWD